MILDRATMARVYCFLLEGVLLLETFYVFQVSSLVVVCVLLLRGVDHSGKTIFPFLFCFLFGLCVSWISL